jgi:hypothetical protein
MGKKYFDTKEGTLESSVLGVWKDAAEMSEQGHDGRTKSYKEHRAKLESARARREEKKMDKVNPKALKKDFDDRKDKDIDNDGDVDDSDEYLHNRRKTVSKAVKKEEVELDEKVKEYKGVAYFKDRKDAEAHMKKFAPKGRVREYDRGYAIQTKISGPYLNKSGKVEEEKELDEDIMPLIFGGGIIAGLLPVLYLSAKEIAGPSIGKLVDKLKKNKNYKMSDSEKSDVKKFVSKVKKEKPSLLQKAMKKIKEEVEIEESYELGTNEYRDHALDTTPGQSLTWGSANAYKQASMKEALAKVWGLDEKVLDKSEESDTIAPVKGKKSMTGGKVADVDVDPEMKKEDK